MNTAFLHVLGAVCLAITAAQAADYPVKPVRIVNPYTPGGGVDVVGRAIASHLSESWKQPVIVDNRPGAGTTVGMEIVANAVPDGHTLLVTNGSVATAPALYRNLKFSVVRDLAPVALAAQSPYILAVHPSVKAANVREWIDLARAQQGRMIYGSVGVGSLQHLMMELVKSMTRIDLVHVAYKGGAPAITALLSGEVQVNFAPLSTILPHVRSGKTRALGVSTLKRVELAPELLPIAEQGVPGFDCTTWYPFFAPGRTPAAVIRKINDDINQVLKKPDLRSRFLAVGVVTMGGAPDELRDYLAVEIQRWSKVIADTGVKAD